MTSPENAMSMPHSTSVQGGQHFAGDGSSSRVMPWRWACRTLGAIALGLAGLILLDQTRVGGGTLPRRTCGSAWDVIAGRVGWAQWWSADLNDGGRSSAEPLLRSLRCPGALNSRLVTAGAVALAGLALFAIGEVVARRRTAPVANATLSAMARRLKRLGVTLTASGGVLTLAGLAGIAVLVADPHATLFLYVRRPVVVIAGLLLLLPSLVLVAIGRSASVTSEYVAERVRRETA